MRTLEWIVAENDRIVREHDASCESPVEVTPEEAEFIYREYGGCVAKFSCDLRAVTENGNWVGWACDRVSPVDEMPGFLRESVHYAICDPCRMALLARRIAIGKHASLRDKIPWKHDYPNTNGVYVVRSILNDDNDGDVQLLTFVDGNYYKYNSLVRHCVKPGRKSFIGPIAQ